MDSPEFLVRLCLVVAYLGPAYLILRFSEWRLTIPSGAFIAWCSGLMAGHALFALDPKGGGQSINGRWLLLGWIPCLFYAGFFYGVRRPSIYLRHQVPVFIENHDAFACMAYWSTRLFWLWALWLMSSTYWPIFPICSMGGHFLLSGAIAVSAILIGISWAPWQGKRWLLAAATILLPACLYVMIDGADRARYRSDPTWWMLIWANRMFRPVVISSLLALIGVVKIAR